MSPEGDRPLTAKETENLINRILQGLLPHLRQNREATPPAASLPSPGEEEVQQEVIDLAAATPEQVKALDNDLPQEPPRTPSVVSSEAPEVEPSLMEKRRAVISQAIETLTLPQPAPPVTPASGLDFPLANQEKQAAPSFCWTQATKEMVQQLGLLMQGKGPLAVATQRGSSKKKDSTPSSTKRWRPGENFFSPNLPPPHRAVSKDDYRPSDGNTLPTSFAVSEHGDMVPFKLKEHPVDLNRPVVVKSKTLQECESVARLACGAANSASTLLRLLRELTGSELPGPALPVLDQLSFDMAALVQYTWRSASNWQLLRRQAALDGLKEAGFLSASEEEQLYSAPLDGPYLFGPLDKEGNSALQVVRNSQYDTATKQAAMNSAINAKATVERSMDRGQKRPAQAAGGSDRGQFKIPKTITSDRKVSAKGGSPTVTVRNQDFKGKSVLDKSHSSQGHSQGYGQGGRYRNRKQGGGGKGKGYKGSFNKGGKGGHPR